MRKLPPLNSIRAFEAVARHLSFTDAAHELSVTVTAVSHQVRQLESSVGHKLFDRGGNRVELTSVGASIYPELCNGFDRIAGAFATISAPRGGDTVKVTTTRAFAERWLVPRLARFNEAHPNIVVHIEAFEDGIDLSAEGIDIAIRYGPSNNVDSGSILFEDRYIAVAKAMPGKSQKRPTIDAFTSRPLLAFKWKNKKLKTPTWSRWLEVLCETRAVDFKVSWYSEETLALHAAEQGLGPLLCSDVLIEDALQAGRMQRIDGPALPGFAFRLVQLSESERRRAARRFVEWLWDEAAQFKQDS